MRRQSNYENVFIHFAMTYLIYVDVHKLSVANEASSFRK